MRLRELAAARVRFGYRRLTVLLKRDGWDVNAKRIYRLYQEEGLIVRAQKRKKAAQARVPVASAERPNQRWSMDFVSDRLADGRWFAYHATILENETGMRGFEVRNLQMKSIDLAARQIQLHKSKTTGGVRTIPLSPDALESVKELLVRAQHFGACEPDHYLIPAIVGDLVKGKNDVPRRIRRYDPGQPTKGWRTAWRRLTEQAGMKGLRRHDLRHNWITSHAEIGTPQSVLEAQSGHLSKRMSDHYKHISEKAARKATDELARVKTAQRAEVRAKMAAQSSSDA